MVLIKWQGKTNAKFLQKYLLLREYWQNMSFLPQVKQKHASQGPHSVRDGWGPLKFSVPASMTFLVRVLGGDQEEAGRSPWNGDGWKASLPRLGWQESLSPLLPLVIPYSEQLLPRGCHQWLSAHWQFSFHPSWQLWRQSCPRLSVGKAGAGLTSPSPQLREEVTGGKDGEDYPVHYVLGRGGCWGETRTLPLLPFHFDLSVCWGTQPLKAKGDK